MNSLVLIDICGTVYNSNTTFDFLDFCISKRYYIRLRKIMHSVGWRALNKLCYRGAKVDLTRAIAVSTIKGISREDLLSLAEKFYDIFLSKKVNTEVMSRIQDLQREGYRLVLASATLDFIAETIARKLNIADYIATELTYENGICLGKIRRDRLGKKLTALKKNGFYPPYHMTMTDNYSDTDILKQSCSSMIITQEIDRAKWLKLAEKHMLNHISFIYV